MSTVKPNELESMQAYYHEPRYRRNNIIRCPGCGERLGIGYEDGDKCDDCIQVEADLKKRQEELDQ